jgi:hypothetical protein
MPESYDTVNSEDALNRLECKIELAKWIIQVTSNSSQATVAWEIIMGALGAEKSLAEKVG